MARTFEVTAGRWTYSFHRHSMGLIISKHTANATVERSLVIPNEVMGALRDFLAQEPAIEAPEPHPLDIGLMRARLEALEAAAAHLCDVVLPGDDYLPDCFPPTFATVTIQADAIRRLRIAVGGRYDPQPTTYQGEPS